MDNSQEAFPAYKSLLALTSSYGGIPAFAAMLQQAQDMSANGRNLEEKGARFSAQGRRVYGHAHGVQDFVDAARKSFEAANAGNMDSFDPRSGRRG